MKKPEYTTVSGEVSIDRKRAISRTLNRWRKRQSAKTHEEMLERIDEFFRVVEELEIVPSEQLLSLCVGCNRSTFYRHKRGQYCSRAVSEAVNKACGLIQAQIELATSEGRLNPIYSIWIQKSRYGYSDQLHESEAERMLRLSESERPYQLPGDILQKYLAMKKETVSETILEPQTIYSLPQPVESHLSATTDPWMTIPEDDFDLPFGLEDEEI